MKRIEFLTIKNIMNIFTKFSTLAFIAVGSTAFGQQFMGYNTSNFGGLHSLSTNVASGVNSRVRLDVNLLSIDGDFGNNYFGVKSGFNDVIDTMKFERFRSGYLKENSGNNLHQHANLRVLGPSVMFNTGRLSFGITTEARFMQSISGVDKGLMANALGQLKEPSYAGKTFDLSGMSVNAASWTELGAFFGYEIHKSEAFTVAVAGRVKLLGAAVSSYLTAKKMTVSFTGDSLVNVGDLDLNYGYSKELDGSGSDFGNTASEKLNPFSNPSFAFDGGITVEWRPKFAKALTGSKVNYLFKFGAAINDIGSLNFQNGKYSGSYSGPGKSFRLESVKDSVKNPEILGTFLGKNFTPAPSTTQDYSMRLPGTLNLQVDYHLFRPFFVNLNAVLPFSEKFNDVRLHNLTMLTLTPRFESAWIDASLPMTYNGYGQFEAGASLRLGPIVVGSRNALNYLINSYNYGLNAYVGLKVLIGRKKAVEKSETVTTK